MNTVILAAFTFCALVAGLFVGHRLAAKRGLEELDRLRRRYQRVVDFADEYIEANAPRRALHVIRDEEGHIVDLLMRCGTPSLAMHELLEEKRRQRALH